MSEETLQFQAEVSRLLDIVAKSLYSEKEVFLRELISNASDACDRLRYAGLTAPELLADGNDGDGDGGAFKITLTIDKPGRTLTVADNGIGMDREDLLANLGTIARSGTSAFLDSLGGESKNDVALIGQFGVGFYSAFMVADKVSVRTRKAGEEQSWQWVSDGRGEFTISETEDVARGTEIVMHLSEGQDEFLEPTRIRQIVKTHSDHIAIPVVLAAEPATDAAENGDAAEAEAQPETLNQASALWTRPRNEIGDDDYKEFYHHVAHAFDEPWLRLHYRAEGMIEYTALLFVPTSAPFDLFHPDREHRVKLYVRRVFVSDRAEGLLPPYLRFLRGIVDSEDLPLNVSREMLQSNPLVAKIRQGLTKRVLSELGKRADKDAEGYDGFWSQFGPVLKEGAYEDSENRESLLALMRFRSTHDDGESWVSLADYVGRLKEGQEAIYTITGDNLDTVKTSPQLEGFRARGIEVLLLTDPVDEFWMPAIGQHQDKPFKSVTRGGSDLSKIKADDDAETAETAKESVAAETEALITALKAALGDHVKDVRSSERLTDSAVCLVADEGDMDMHLERLLMKHKEIDSAAKRILEINPKHPLIVRLSAEAGGEGGEGDGDLSDMAFLLLDQARIVEGESVPDPAAFSRRLSAALERTLGS